MEYLQYSMTVQGVSSICKRKTTRNSQTVLCALEFLSHLILLLTTYAHFRGLFWSTGMVLLKQQSAANIPKVYYAFTRSLLAVSLRAL